MNAPHPMDRRLRAAAHAILPVAQQASGMMPIESRLEDESEAVTRIALEAAARVLAALEALPPVPRPRGPLTGADAAALRLELGAATVLILARDQAGRASGVRSAASVGEERLDPEQAQTAWAATARVAVSAAASAPQPQTEET